MEYGPQLSVFSALAAGGGVVRSDGDEEVEVLGRPEHRICRPHLSVSTLVRSDEELCGVVRAG